jgi:hypothetical protein
MQMPIVFSAAQRHPRAFRAVVLVGALCLAACATQDGQSASAAGVPAVTPPASEAAAASGGQLTLVTIDPPPGSSLAEDTVLKAVFDYSIQGRHPGARYGVAVFFGDKRGEGRTFSALNDPVSSTPLRENAGRVTLRHSIKAEWKNPNLARPVTVWFDIIEERRPGSGQRSVTEVGPFEYK